MGIFGDLFTFGLEVATRGTANQIIDLFDLRNLLSLPVGKQLSSHVWDKTDKQDRMSQCREQS